MPESKKEKAAAAAGKAAREQEKENWSDVTEVVTPLGTSEQAADETKQSTTNSIGGEG
jgi:hypothetical protein